MLSATVFSQVNPTQIDSTGYSTGRLDIKNPNSIVNAYTYDAATNRYIYTSTMDGFNINYPIILTPKEYEELVLRESMREYFKKKSDAIDGKKDGSEAAKKDLLPRYYVNSSFFETIFGSNTIDVKPTGSVEMDLGVRYTKQDNPSFSPRNRAQTSFDFDQRISMSLNGKVGTRLSVNANYDTESTFAFQNLIKLEYAPTEDDIIQKIEVGNVSMPLSNSLIRGAQSLFGVKAQLQFGKTTITGVFSEQKSQTKSVTAQGGGTIQDFELFALDYDADRHFFLSQYFRNKYDDALRDYPVIRSRVQITRIEVWVTNRQNRVSTTNNNLRNIIALQDLGESHYTDVPDSRLVAINPQPANFFVTDPEVLPDNEGILPSDNRNNKYDPGLIIPATPPNPNYPGLLNTNIRDIVTSSAGFNNINPVDEGTDYSKLENARKLAPNEYTLNPQLGYISLQQRLANDEVLAVAYQYTIGDNVYQVGEFGTDGVDSTVITDATSSNPSVSTQSLILKMLKSNLTNVEKPIWNLMMKNIYQIQGGYQLQQEDFRFNILYTDPSPINYITPVAGTPFPASPTTPPGNEVSETPLLKVFNVDKLNYNNDPQLGGDGFFDFLPGITVDQQNGRLIFTTVEPFGKLLFEKLRLSPAEDYYNESTYNANQAKYVFREMYIKTQAAALQDAEKNKFQLKGRYKSAGGDGIPIGAYNVPRGSVVVTAGGRVLQEGIDYSVNYQAGRVQILDPSLQASNTPIQVSVENNSTFGQQTRRFMGFNVEHKFSDKLLLGATFIKMTERPLTTKSNYGQESVNNTIFGLNANYSTEVPFLTRMVNKLPNIDTDVPSNFSLRGEVAFLKPDASKSDQFEGEPTVYVDDFEGSQTTIDMRSAQSWSLSSTPKRPTTADYNDFGSSAVGLDYGYKRAKLNWYSIDPTLYVQTPGDIGQDGISANNTRRVFIRELFDTDPLIGQSTVINTLDLRYYPQERGPYNYNPQALSSGFSDTEAKDNFGGIMRAINSTNFEQSNVEYIQFWVLDPYFDPSNPTAVANSANSGQIYFNLGEISEDVLKDERKQYENGLPDNSTSQALTNPTVWGKVPSSQSLIYAFDVDGANRAAQDVGFDGVNNSAEQSLPGIGGYAALADPAADDYQYFLSASGSTIFDRYRSYNGVEGNSPVDLAGSNRGSTTIPDVEDINRDNTMNTANAYYEYKIDMNYGNIDGSGMTVGQNFITDKVVTNVSGTPNGIDTQARWYQFKIPVTQPTNVIGSISDFRSIRFMRMFMTGFSSPITVRFGALDLVRGEWRRYDNSFQITDTDPTDDNTNFDVLSVNIQENSQRVPIHYVTPPGVILEQVSNGQQVINQNEQSLSLRACELEIGDSRAVFKNVDVDMRQYNKLKMFLHAEALPTDVTPLQDNQLKGFIRFGNDFTNNFYQVEIPLKVTPTGATDPDVIWPAENEINLNMSLLTKMKVRALSIPLGSLLRDENGIYYPDNDPALAPDGDGDPNLSLGIKGTPNFGLVRTLMVGIKNNTGTALSPAATPICGEVWFNELRLADLNNKGGMAAVLNMDTNLADFATLSGTGRMSTIGFGALEQGPQERSREDMQQYNIVSNLSLGKLLPKKWGINLPFNYAVGEETITPEYDPFNQDIRLEQLLSNTTDAAERENIRSRAIDFTKRKSINFIGVKKDRAAEQKQHIYDPENLTLSYSYNQVEKHNYEIENYIDQQVNTSVDYTYSFKNKAIEPFKKNKFFKKSSYWKMLSDFNFNYLPASISFSSNIIRQYNKQQFRQVDVAGIALDPLFRRNYMFNYQYGFNYNITKALKLNFTASTHNIVRTYLDENNVPDNSNTIWTDFWNIGTPNQHNQQIVLNYELPINKIPFLAFIKSTYSYTGNYSWQKSSLALSSVDGYDLGNTIQNAASHRLNTAFSMETFYKFIGLGKKPAPSVQKPVTLPKPGEKIIAVKAQPAKTTSVFLDGLKGVLTSVKNIQVNYTQNEGTVLPGFLPGLGFFGSSKPSLSFVFGGQDDVRYEAAKRGWLTSYPEFNQNYTEVVTKTLNLTANVDLFPDFKIDLNADRTYANNFSEQFYTDDAGYHPQSPYNFGNFSISAVMLKTSFKASDENSSSSFQDFRENRIIIANRLATQYYGSSGYPTYGDAANPVPAPTDPSYNFYTNNFGFPIGFGKNNQAVLIPSFLAAYTGLYTTGAGDVAKGISLGAFRNFPIPNWTIKYSGLMRYKFFKERFKRFSIQHAYRASYTINSFRSNLDYDPNQANQDNGGYGNFFNKTIIANINLVEQFNPLIRIDFEMKNAFKILAEIKKDRSLSMSFDNNLLTEVQGKEFIVGVGYRFKDVIFSSQLADNPTGIIKSDINVKVDFSYRNNKTIVRYLDYDNNQLGGGQNIWSAKLTADYSFSKNLTAIFFYDHSFSKPVISTSFPLTNIRAGFTMRYNFGN
ncbi:cell surface protein SprA [Flavobacterium sp.]|uniref:T9SS outer membrane translocon Sov/SprA n=1 Tax=Flavobacterium sp. TaxID=239 RepID=UPI0025EB9168|nr:cell surface protein SprA [Flavobacterium sp.]